MSFAAKKKARAELGKHWLELATRKTEDGREKRCPKCGDWWPHDETCFSWSPTQGHYRSWCKACEVDRTRAYRKRIQSTARTGIHRGTRSDSTESKEAAS